MITNSGVHPSLHQNCHHQKIFAKVNMKIFYPPCNTNVEAINSAIESFNWEKAFDGKDIHAQVALFNETLLNIFSNFIPNRTKTFTYSDPPWMTEDIKNKIKLKNNLYCQCMKHQTQIRSLLKVEDLRIEISNLITKSKEKYYQRINAKLNDPSLSNKTYWSILKTFYNGKKVPIIPPLFINNKFVTDFQEKANAFNSFFVKQCSPIASSSVLPAEISHMTKDRIKTICFGKSDVIKLIKALNVSNAHGHDRISVKIIKICADSIAHPLTLIFQNSLVAGIFTNDWKKANIVPIHKKNDK